MTVQLEIPADIVSAMRLPEPEIPARLRLELAWRCMRKACWGWARRGNWPRCPCWTSGWPWAGAAYRGSMTTGAWSRT